MTAPLHSKRETVADKFRVKFIDGDFRREPDTDHYCCRCQKDMKADQPHRVVHLVDGGPNVLHPGDEDAYTAWSETFPGGQHPGELGCHLIGMDCAKKLGLEWTHPASLPGGRQ